MARIKEIADYINNELGKEAKRINMTIKEQDDYDIIETTSKKRLERQHYASISIVVDERRDYLGFHIGEGNFFDTSEPYGSRDKVYALDIVRASIAGKVEETVKEKSGKVLSSKIKIELPAGKETFSYHNGLFQLGGKKHFRYNAYPE